METTDSAPPTPSIIPLADHSMPGVLIVSSLPRFGSTLAGKAPGVSFPGSCLRSSDVLGSALPPRLDFSIVDSFVYSRVPSEHSSSPRFGYHVFRGGDAPTLLPQARLPRETISFCWGASPPVDAVGRLALAASTSFRINRCHKGILIHTSTL